MTHHDTTTTTELTRRQFVSAGGTAAALALAGCAQAPRARRPSAQLSRKPAAQLSGSRYARIYGPLPHEQFPVPAVDLRKVDPRFFRQEVDFETMERPGTVVVNTRTFHLHLVGQNGRAMRYGVGLGRAGFGWAGQGKIAWKEKWPNWVPPEEMIDRQPELERWSAENGGMPPGLGNPLGARALYIFKDGKDTLYRLHGTQKESSIGKAVSSGCVRLMNHDIIDLYDRVPAKPKIVVV